MGVVTGDAVLVGLLRVPPLRPSSGVDDDGGWMGVATRERGGGMVSETPLDGAATVRRGGDDGGPDGTILAGPEGRGTTLAVVTGGGGVAMFVTRCTAPGDVGRPFGGGRFADEAIPINYHAEGNAACAR